MGFSPQNPQPASGNEVGLEIECVVYGGVAGQEPLGGPQRLEALLLSFSSANRQVRVFGAIVFPQATRQGAVGNPGQPAAR